MPCPNASCAPWIGAHTYPSSAWLTGGQEDLVGAEQKPHTCSHSLSKGYFGFWKGCLKELLFVWDKDHIQYQVSTGQR